MFRQSLVLFVSQLLFFAFSAATLNDILWSTADQTTPLSSEIVASFLVKYFGNHIHPRNAKHISLVTHVNSDRHSIHENYISHLLHSIQAEFSYRFLNNLQCQPENIGASIVVFLVANYKEWQ